MQRQARSALALALASGWALVAASLVMLAASSIASAGPLVADYIPDQLIICFQDVPAPGRLDVLKARFPQIQSWRELRHVPHPKNDPTGVHPLAKMRVVQLAKGSDVFTLVQQMNTVTGVRFAEPNPRMNLCTSPSDYIPNDPLLDQQWALERIEAFGAWDYTTGDSSVVIAVLDTGLYFEHEEYQEGVVWVNPGEIPDNGIDDDGNGFIDDVNGWNFSDGNNDPSEQGSHGTPVTGVLAARMNNGLGIAGLAGVTIMPLVTGSGGLPPWIEAMYYATDMGVRAYNISAFGSGARSIELAVEYAWDNGVTVVAASGNFGTDDFEWYPAAYPTVIGVGATESDDTHWDRSNGGDWLDVVAPGVDILSTSVLGPDSYRTTSGTSLATPYCCALVGLLYSVDATLTPAQVRLLLRDSADDFGDPGFDIYYGYGRINARRAVEATLHHMNCPADVDYDGDVDSADLAVLLSEWGSCPPEDPCSADLDGDDDVDSADLAHLLANWTLP